MGFVLFLFGALLIAAGAWAHMWRRRRQFYRTNAAGVEEFKSYGASVKSAAAEAAAHTVFVICLIGGLLVWAVAFIGNFK